MRSAASALLLSAVACAAAAEPPVVAEPAARPGAAVRSGDGRRTTGRLLANLGRGALGVVSADSVAPLIAGAALTGGASFLDATVRDRLASPGSTIGRGGQIAGGAPVTAAVATGLYAAGRLSKSPRWRDFSYDLFCATAVTAAWTHAVKYAVGRERPNGDGGRANSSFPSGHAANAFAWASVLERHYGWKAAVPGYAVAAVIGASRIQENKHWLSDVVGGAALGYIAGRALVRVNGAPLPRAASRASLTLAPILGPRAAGLRLSAAF